MSEIISSSNIDLVIQRNREISDEVSDQALKLQTNPRFMIVNSMPQLAVLILRTFGLIQVPIDDKYWSGAIFVKEGKQIPVINTAMPRVNQYFTAWHEIYHLIFDNLSLDHIIENDNTMDERKAEYFAACMLLRGVDKYFAELPQMEYLSKVLCCMSAFQAPYKAVLISLYEDAVRRENTKMQDMIKDILDIRIDDLAEKFRELGLDDSLVEPSFVINTAYLQEQIEKKEAQSPDLKYHEDNDKYLKNIVNEIHLIMENG